MTMMSRVTGVRAHRANPFLMTALCRQVLAHLIKMVPMAPGLDGVEIYKEVARASQRLLLTRLSQHQRC